MENTDSCIVRLHILQNKQIKGNIAINIFDIPEFLETIVSCNIDAWTEWQNTKFVKKDKKIWIPTPIGKIVLADAKIAPLARNDQSLKFYAGGDIIKAVQASTAFVAFWKKASKLLAQ